MSKQGRTCVFVVATLLALAGLAGIAEAGWITTKATIAQHLLQRAWRRGLAQDSTRPWPWADVTVVARLDLPSLGQSSIVLSNASGEALAFGPGLVAGDPAEADRSTIVIGGHRDTHLAPLRDLEPGAIVELITLEGIVHRYRATEGVVVDTRERTLGLRVDATGHAAGDAKGGGAGLVLVTCWPFDAVFAGGPMRYVVIAIPVVIATPEPSRVL